MYDCLWSEREKQLKSGPDFDNYEIVKRGASLSWDHVVLFVATRNRSLAFWSDALVERMDDEELEAALLFKLVDSGAIGSDEKVAYELARHRGLITHLKDLFNITTRDVHGVAIYELRQTWDVVFELEVHVPSSHQQTVAFLRIGHYIIDWAISDGDTALRLCRSFPMLRGESIRLYVLTISNGPACRRIDEDIRIRAHACCLPTHERLNGNWYLYDETEGIVVNDWHMGQLSQDKIDRYLRKHVNTIPGSTFDVNQERVTWESIESAPTNCNLLMQIRKIPPPLLPSKCNRLIEKEQLIVHVKGKRYDLSKI